MVWLDAWCRIQETNRGLTIEGHQCQSTRSLWWIFGCKLWSEMKDVEGNSLLNKGIFGQNHQINLSIYKIFLFAWMNKISLRSMCGVGVWGIKSGQRSRQAAERFGIIKTCDAHCIARAKGLSSGGTLRKVLMSRFCGLASKQQYLQFWQQNKQLICDHFF